MRFSRIGLDCGTVTGWSRGCRCAECAAAHADDVAKWREKMATHEKTKRADAVARRMARVAAMALQVRSTVFSAPLPARKPAERDSVSFEDAWRRRG